MTRKPASKEEITIVPIERLERQIYLIRGQKVMLDADLAELYQVPTKNLNRAVRRNRDRFPDDFLFQFTKDEAHSLQSQSRTLASRFQNGTLKRGQNLKYLPYAFTEHGVAMLSSVLKSRRAAQMSILIVRAFVRLREILASHRDLAARIERLEASHGEHTSVINLLAEEIDSLKRLPPDVGGNETMESASARWPPTWA